MVYILRIRPAEPDWPDRDRFILSKGHSSLGQYAAMALAGYFPVDELATFDQKGSRLQGHPDMNRLPGIDMSTGSLGMGLSAGLGFALGRSLPGPRRAHLGAPRRRRVPGGPGLGGRPRGPALPRRQPHRHRRPQSAPAVRLARRLGHATGSRPRSRVTSRHGSRPSAGGSWRWTATTCAALARHARARRASRRACRWPDLAHTSRATASRSWTGTSRGTWVCPARRSSRSPWPSSASPCEEAP